MCERIISGVQHNIKHIIRFCTSIYFVFNLYSSWRTFDQTVILICYLSTIISGLILHTTYFLFVKRGRGRRGEMTGVAILVGDDY